MGLLQRAVETYDANAALAGVYRDKREPLAPIGHVLTSAHIEITLNAQGGFKTARRVEKNEPKILIPVTEESGGRTSGIAAHPLCEQLKYVACTNVQAHESYLTALRTWMESPHGHPFLPAIFTYVMHGTILNDLTKGGVLDLTEKGEYNEKLLICWRVLGIDGEEPGCWKNRSLFAAFQAYYGSLLAAREEALCMVEGQREPVALQHPKGIIPVNGNAKLISANDGSGFTYRGRFLDEKQAATVGYLQLSGLQHFRFCRRQWALIHIEKLWAENLRTVDGEILHEHAHDPGLREKRPGLIIVRGMVVSSRTLGVSGACDVVEFRRSAAGVPLRSEEGLFQPYPVEYKRGAPRADHANELQLCGQALCLEEMLCCDIPKGALYFGETRRRVEVAFTPELRREVTETLTEMHRLYRRGYTPKVKPTKACNACSLKELCLPKLMRSGSVKSYLERHMEDTV